MTLARPSGGSSTRRSEFGRVRAVHPSMPALGNPPVRVAQSIPQRERQGAQHEYTEYRPNAPSRHILDRHPADG